MTDKTKTGSKPSDSKTRQKSNDVDRQSEDSFPASDPPSYAGGQHSIGEPPRPDKVTKK
ncbi:MAG: hypothetical protein ABSC92_06010 [Rhizomicrobium sp.]|jgi:hypothetical protein